jgi:hypothetical protein
MLNYSLRLIAVNSKYRGKCDVFCNRAGVAALEPAKSVEHLGTSIPESHSAHGILQRDGRMFLFRGRFCRVSVSDSRGADSHSEPSYSSRWRRELVQAAAPSITVTAA